MKEIIINKLREIEEKENVRILMAVESGSRAWGFASPDSDYDVRFIYVRRNEDYLRLNPFKDVIELPINDVLDINGWDLKKALTLFYKSNPTLFEWLNSPIVYMKTTFLDEMKNIAGRYFSEKRSLYHYISMAQRHYNEYLKGDTVKVKKYFYALRPVLACRWIMKESTPPPMLFSELVKAQLPSELFEYVDKLLKLKIDSPELKVIHKIEPLNNYICASIERIKNDISKMKENKNIDWEELNNLFLKEVFK